MTGISGFLQGDPSFTSPHATRGRPDAYPCYADPAGKMPVTIALGDENSGPGEMGGIVGCGGRI